MKNKDIDRKIDTAFSNICPNISESILGDCKFKKGEVIEMKKSNKKFIRPLLGAAAVFAIIFSMLLFYSFYSSNKIAKTTVSLDVNPSVEISLNSKDKVLEAKALNSDGEKILEGMDLKDAELDTTINAIIGSMVKNGYINDIANSVLISIDSSDTQKNELIEKSVCTLTRKYLENMNIEGAVLSQSFNSDELKAVRDFAKENNISQGKAKYIFEVKKIHPEYDEDDLVRLSINELNLIADDMKSKNIKRQGESSSKAYIGNEKAIELAKEYAEENGEIIPDNKSKIDCELDLEHIGTKPVIIYEIEIKCDKTEYEVEIDAKSGKLISFESEKDKDGDNDRDDESKIPKGSYIAKDDAINIALNYSGLKNGDVQKIKAKMKNDDGKIIYEVKFIFNATKYEYEIDAKTRAILDLDIDYYEKER